MYIRKITEGSGIPNNAVLDGYSTSQTDAYSCNQVNKFLTYSTNEIRIGTWVDGKPIYRKVIKKTTGFSTGEQEVQHEISNVSEFTNIRGTLYRKNGDWQPLAVTAPPPSYHTQFQISVYDFNSTRYRMYLGTSMTGNSAPEKMYLILEYTKTND